MFPILVVISFESGLVSWESLCLDALGGFIKALDNELELDAFLRFLFLCVSDNERRKLSFESVECERFLIMALLLYQIVFLLLW